jgi:creatinine amidohydrolase
MSSVRLTLALVCVVTLVACTPADEPPVSQGAERVPISGGRLLKLEELTYPAIDEIDRDRSIFFLTFGNLEEHGPHIPVGSDYYQSNGVRDLLIKRLHAKYPEYDMVVVPVIPLGEGGANNVARQFDHVGTFDIRYSTLRAVTIDMGASIASKGFQNIFLIHHHAAVLHNVAFNEASAFVSETYGVNMVNITSLALAEGFYSNAVLDKHLGEGWLQESGIIGHAGTAETSANLFLHDLVNPIYRDLEAFVVEEFAGIFRINERSGWQGYWSDPSRASAEIGRDLINDIVERSLRIAELALRGEDLSGLPLYPDDTPPMPERDALLAELIERYDAREAEIKAWLEKRHDSN